MKYWCPECNTVHDNEILGVGLDLCNCSVCADFKCKKTRLLKLPDFETPAQYEKRTGKKWNGAVWIKAMKGLFKSKYVCRSMAELIANSMMCWPPIDLYKYTILCAASPEPPPDDYVSEVEA